MRKRILSFVLVFALVCAMSISVSAGSASVYGETSGSKYNPLETSGELYVYTDHAVAETWCEVDSFVVLTKVYFIHKGENNVDVTYSDSGRTTASAYRTGDLTVLTGVRGSSLHKVESDDWGNWTYSLNANLY